MYEYKDLFHYLNTCKKIMRGQHITDIDFSTNDILFKKIIDIAEKLWYFCKRQSYIDCCKDNDYTPSTHLFTMSLKSASTLEHLEYILKNIDMYFNDPISNRELSNYQLGKGIFDADEFDYLNGVFGIYKLYDIDKNLLYIGKSVNLSSRLLGSSMERKAYFYSYAKVNSKSDLNIYEYYYISVYKPPLNVEGVYDDVLSVHLPELKFSDIKSLRKSDVNE